MSLAEFAASSTRKRVCSVCTTLPDDVLAEVDEGLRSGIGPTIVCRWLKENGHITTVARLSHHKRDGHPENKARVKTVGPDEEWGPGGGPYESR